MLQIALLKWQEAEPIAAPIRFAVFIELKQANGIELDDLDKDCVHAVAYDDNRKPVGTARLLPSGEVGRMAVMKEWRRRGVGEAMLDALTEEARKRGYRSLAICAPLQAAEFYRGQGFVAEGKVQQIEGSLHQAMRKPLL